MVLHWILLIWSIAAFLGSIYLVKEHERLDRVLDDFKNPEKVSCAEYVATATVGWITLFVSPGCIVASVVLLIIDYFC